MAETELVDPTLTEIDKVFVWRYEQLLAAGLSDRHATAVAESGYDLHRALAMLEAGCAGKVLVKITRDE